MLAPKQFKIGKHLKKQVEDEGSREGKTELPAHPFCSNTAPLSEWKLMNPDPAMLQCL